MADRIEELMKHWEPAIRNAVLAAIKGWRDSIRLADLVELIKAKDVERVIQAIGLEPARFRPLSLAIERAFEAGGVDATLGVQGVAGPLGLRVRPIFDVKAPAAQTWLQTHTTDLIRQITDDQRVLIRNILSPFREPLGADPMLTGDTPQKLALDLIGRVNRTTGQREGGVLGLTSQQADWAANYAHELQGVPSADALTRKLRDRRFDAAVKKAIKTEQPIPAATRAAMVAAYRNRALRLRAETIALNEASTALHEAQVQAWDQAIARGAARPDQVRRFWVTAGDDHVRPTHRAVPGMNPKGVGLHEPFQTPKGPTLQPGWAFDPGCRCRVRVKVVEAATPSPAAPTPARAPVPALAAA